MGDVRRDILSNAHVHVQATKECPHQQTPPEVVFPPLSCRPD